MFYLTLRKETPLIFKVSVPIASILLTILFGIFIFSVLGYDSGKALYHFFISPLSRIDRIADLFVKACPLMIVGTGLVLCFRANIWNIGAEGQLIMGAVFAGGLALSFPDTNSVWLLPAMAVLSFIGGGLWALLPAILKVRLRTNEILVSLMLTYVASLFLDWLVRGPWRSPTSFGFPLTNYYPDAGLISKINFPGIGTIGQLHWGVFIAILVCLLCWFMMQKTVFGFQVKLVGDSHKAFRYSGFSESKTTMMLFIISGGLAGLAGMIEVSANIGQLQPNISFGYGFTAIIVAFLARLNPAAVILAGLLIALIEMGGDSAQIALAIPKVVTGVFKGILLFLLLAGETLTKYQINVKPRQRSVPND